MAVPSYTTDLTTIAIGEIAVDTGTWDESSDAGWDTAGTMVADTNLYYNGVECVSAQYTKLGTGTGASGPGTIMYVHPSSFTIPTDGAILIHHLWAAPAALNALAPGAGEAGITMLVGNSFGDCDIWNMSGSDFAPAPRGGWANYAVNPTVTRDTLIGAGAASPYTTVGIGVAATAQARGNPQACNAIRYGRCEAIFTGGQAADYATFAGYGTVDNASAARWNLIEPVGTSGFIMQGLQSLGTAATPVDFRDQNKKIDVRDTINVTAGFNKMNVVNAGSNIEWTAISIASLGTIAKWAFEVLDDAPVSKVACTFTDDGAFTYKSNSVIATTTYRRCGLITQGSASMTGCTIDSPTGAVAMAANAIGSVSNSTFNSVGTGHAVDLGIIAATASVAWANNTTGYAVANGATGNEVILVNVAAGQTLTINVGDGYTPPTYYNTGAGTVLVVAGQKTFTQSISPIPTPNYEYRLYTVTAKGSMDGSVEIVAEGEENATTGSHSYTHSETNQPIAVQVISNDYVEATYYDTLTAADKTVTINLELDTND